MRAAVYLGKEQGKGARWFPWVSAAFSTRCCGPEGCTLFFGGLRAPRVCCAWGRSEGVTSCPEVRAQEDPAVAFLFTAFISTQPPLLGPPRAERGAVTAARKSRERFPPSPWRRVARAAAVMVSGRDVGAGARRGGPAAPTLSCRPQASAWHGTELSPAAEELRAAVESERRLEEAVLRTVAAIARSAQEERRQQRRQERLREERLAAELERLKREELKDEKMRQQVRENSLELRELERKLKSAYLNRERAAQIAEKEGMQYESTKREAEIAQKMKEEYERAAKEESLAELKRNEEKIMYHQELEKQLEEQQQKKQGILYEEFLKEKLMIDEIIRKISEEDQMKRQLKLEKMRATQMCIEEFKKEQAVWRERKREKVEEENRKIMEFANSQRQREEARMAKIRDMEEKKQRLQAMIAQNLEREQQKRDDLEQMRQELYLEEQLEMDRKKELAETERRIRQRLDLRQMYEEQFALKKIAQQAIQEEEEAFRQQMVAKFAEDDRVELMNAQKQRTKQLEHRRAVEKLIEDRRKRFIADKERELEERQLEERRQANIRAVVEEERQKLLKEHAPKLLGYLPKGVLKGEDDINMLGEEFRLAYQKRSHDPFSEES
ncbi:meiosis-specific nuclear structural protein 1 [Cyrtonyx montezumae]|uniref:meiosis-specific nuclear structural protein 1 n=1 Tax=Cyrtonyx montezumae TaxID=9017 RepID=UPI0032DB35F6